MQEVHLCRPSSPSSQEQEVHLCRPSSPSSPSCLACLASLVACQAYYQAYCQAYLAFLPCLACLPSLAFLPLVLLQHLLKGQMLVACCPSSRHKKMSPWSDCRSHRASAFHSVGHHLQKSQIALCSLCTHG